MANPNIKDHGFKKGKSGNPSGRRKTPEHLRAHAPLDSEEVKRIMGKYTRMTRLEIQACIEDPLTPAFELAIASTLAKAIKFGDVARMDFFLNRIVGKVKEEQDVHISVALQNLSDAEIIDLSKDAIKVLEGKT
jgi:hypothetical protein